VLGGKSEQHRARRQLTAAPSTYFEKLVLSAYERSNGFELSLMRYLNLKISAGRDSATENTQPPLLSFDRKTRGQWGKGAARAHRIIGNDDGRANPAACKAKYACCLPGRYKRVGRFEPTGDGRPR